MLTHWEKMLNFGISWIPQMCKVLSGKSTKWMTDVSLCDQEDLLAKITKLSRKVESLEVNRRHEVSNVTKAEESCSICESVEHSISECHEQVKAFNQSRQSFSPYSNTYNPG